MPNVVLLAGGYVPETRALLAAMTTKPNAVRAALIDRTIRSLKAAGLWSNLGVFYILAAHSAQAAGLNWVNPTGAALTAVNSPSFVTDRGYTGDGTTSYLDTGILFSAVQNLSQNAAHVGVWNLTTGTSSRGLAGVLSSAQTLFRSGANPPMRLNTGTSFTTTDALTVGDQIGVRRDSANQFHYRNGGGEQSAAAASLVASATNFVVFRDSATFFDGRIACAHAGGALSATDVANVYAIKQTYLYAVGAV